MNPSERIQLIRQISTSLVKEDSSIIDLTLRQFKLSHRSCQSEFEREAYICEEISDASNQNLTDLAVHLGISDRRMGSENPKGWEEEDIRIFISHLDKRKGEAAALAKALQKLGLKTFVAHTDIEPTREWQKEIEKALSTADGLLALIGSGFISSKWCDQEVGFAYARKIPIVPVKFEKPQDPHGFMGQYQAVQAFNQTIPELAKEITELLKTKTTIQAKWPNPLVKRLKESKSFLESNQISKEILALSTHLNKDHLQEIKEAFDNNANVSDAYTAQRMFEQVKSKF